jgi:putative IMPACT (imprinted ancient) family translation regulator
VVAYKEATTDALDQAEVIEKTVDESISILFDYVLMNEVMRIIKDTNAQITSQSFENQCEMQLSIRKQDAVLLSAKLAKIYGLQIKE